MIPLLLDIGEVDRGEWLLEHPVWDGASYDGPTRSQLGTMDVDTWEGDA